MTDITPTVSPRQSARVGVKVDIVVIGAGQAGLSSAYHLRRLGMEADRDFVILDRSPGPGGAWQFRWPSLTLAAANHIHDLPGLPFRKIVDVDASGEVQASAAVPRYYEAYENAFGLSVHRPVTVRVVCERGKRLRVETDVRVFSARGIINATGSWETPHLPAYPGRSRFKGRQIHTRDYLVGYGPSASTIGANRAGGAAARELAAFLGVPTG